MREIQGISGWQLVTPLMGQLPNDTLETLKKCESPIEQLLATALALVLLTIPEAWRPTLETQVPIGKYRADIVLIAAGGAPRIVVECDGADFHKDKARDSKRTEEIERMGYRVFRVTGSQIHHNPLARAKIMLEETSLTLKRTHAA